MAYRIGMFDRAQTRRPRDVWRSVRIAAVNHQDLRRWRIEDREHPFAHALLKGEWREQRGQRDARESTNDSDEEAV